MNIVQEFYEDFIKPKAKVPRLHRKHMDDLIHNDSPLTETPPETLPVVEETPIVEEPVVVKEETPSADRSAFNCPDCKGSGLKDSWNICARCSGTGKI